MSLSLLLVGRDGNGKSSTGNSILGAKLFTPTSNFLSDGVDIKQASREGIEVTEIAGLEHPGSDQSENIEKTLKAIEEIIERNTNGFNAVVFVMKYGIRFTKQEKDCLLMIKSIFGPNVVKHFGVIVMTFGDCFELDVEEHRQTFEEWCLAQTGYVRTLFNDCRDRCVLFNNRTKDLVQMEAQREELFSKVAQITHPYTLGEYKKAVKNQTEILVKSKLPKFEEWKNNKMDEVWNQLKKINEEYSHGFMDTWDLVLFLDSLQQNLLHLKKTLLDEDKNTGVLTQLLYDVPVAEMRIHTQLQMAEQRLQVKASEAKWLIISVDLQSPTETVSIRECSIDGAGNFTIKSVSDIDESGCCIVLVEICKTTSRSQRVTESLGLPVECRHSEMVTDVTNDCEQADAQGHGSQATVIQGLDSQANEVIGCNSQAVVSQDHDSLATVRQDHDSQATVRQDHDSQATVRQDHDSQATVRQDHDSQATVRQDHDSLATVRQDHDSQAVVSQDHDSQATVRQDHDSLATVRQDHDSLATVRQDHDSQATVRQDHDSLATVRQDHDSQATVRQDHDSQATVRQDHDSQATVRQDHDSLATVRQDHDSLATVRQDHDSLATVRQDHDSQATVRQDHDSQAEVLDHGKCNDDLEDSKFVFETINNILKQYNCNKIICLISKYDQTLTKQEIDVLMEKIEATCGTKMVKDHSILILTCDHDNLETENYEMWEKWRKEETNQYLLSACANRRVLLNPWVKDESTLISQKLRFLTMIYSVAGSYMESKKAKVGLTKAQMTTEATSLEPKKAPEKQWYDYLPYSDTLSSYLISKKLK